MDGWNTSFLLGPGLFSGAMLVSGRVGFSTNSPKPQGGNTPRHVGLTLNADPKSRPLEFWRFKAFGVRTFSFGSNLLKDLAGLTVPMGVGA